MLTNATTKCHMCREECYSLKFWKQVGEIYFHICKKCIKKDKTEDDLLNIGWHAGYLDCKEDAQDKLEEL